MFQDLLPGATLGPQDGQNFEHGWQNEFLEAYLITNVGRVRTHNEDCAILCAPADPKVFEEHGVLFAVADGMGGANAGEIASHMALEGLVKQYFRGDAEQEIPSSLREAVQAANESIFKRSQDYPEYQGMGTTVSALVLKDNWAFIAQVGDSRVYLHRQGVGLRQLTRDHSYVAKQVRKGELSPEEAENHEMKNLITRSVGIKEKVKVDLFHLELQPNDAFLICSDGLCGLISDDVIAETLKIRGVRTRAFTAVNKALEAGGHDNVSVICVQVHKLATHIPAPPPTMIKAHLQTNTLQPPAAPQQQQAATEDKPGIESSAFDGMEGLDDDFESFDSIHIDLDSEHGAEQVDEQAPQKPGAHLLPTDTKNEKAPMMLWITIGLGALLILTALTWIFIGGSDNRKSGSSAANPNVPEQDNSVHSAIKMLQDGDTLPNAMREAKRLLAQSPAPSNTLAVVELRKRLASTVEALLKKSPYSIHDQENAAQLVAEILAMDQDPSVQQLQVRVQQENAAHKFMLLEVGAENQTATFSLNNPFYTEKQQTVKVGDMLQDRFRVDLITPQRVRLADTKISGPAGQRMLTAQIRMPVGNE